MQLNAIYLIELPSRSTYLTFKVTGVFLEQGGL